VTGYQSLVTPEIMNPDLKPEALSLEYLSYSLKPTRL
jgi:hypothetical protein